MSTKATADEAADVLGRLHGAVIKLDRSEFGDQYALAVSCAYRKVEALINEELRTLRGGAS